MPKFLLNDNGSVEASDFAAECYARWGIKAIATPSKIPLYSVEREIQLKLDDIEALLLTHPFWTAANWLDAAIKSAQNRSYVFNSSSLTLSAYKTPFELFTHKPPPMDCFSKFGTGDIVIAQTAVEERKIGQSRNQLGVVLEIKDDGSKGSELRMPGKSRVIDRGNLQKVNIPSPPTPRAVSVTRSEDMSSVAVTTSCDVDCSSPQSLMDYQSKLEHSRLQEEQRAALPLLQRIENEATIRDIVSEEHARDPQQDSSTDAGVYVPSSSLPYWPEEELAAFLSTQIFSKEAYLEESSGPSGSTRPIRCSMQNWWGTSMLFALRSAASPISPTFDPLLLPPLYTLPLLPYSLPSRPAWDATTRSRLPYVG